MPQETPRHPLDNRIPPPVLALVIAAVMVLVTRGAAPLAIPAPARYTVSSAFVAVAGFMILPAFAAFGRAGTTINPVRIDTASSLVTMGVYRFTRNPMYLALTCLLIALAVGLARGWAFAGPAIFALYITRFQIIPEERVMDAKFGDAYRDYRRRVRRWL